MKIAGMVYILVLLCTMGLNECYLVAIPLTMRLSRVQPAPTTQGESINLANIIKQKKINKPDAPAPSPHEQPFGQVANFTQMRNKGVMKAISL